MRIVGGTHRGRALLGPEDMGTRPTSDRAREAVFNILAHGKWLEAPLPEDALVLDAFAGTGALGCEALSRGAAHAAFLEQGRSALSVCRANIKTFGFEDRAAVLQADALAPPACAVAKRTLVFLDPPYGKKMGMAALSALAAKGWLEKGAVCVLEMARKQQEDTVSGFEVKDERAYGVALVRFMVWTPQ
jgi:16S rRNA (guanine966-N2)-methyltransferase